jgi:hypothetical protein
MGATIVFITFELVDGQLGSTNVCDLGEKIRVLQMSLCSILLFVYELRGCPDLPVQTESFS